MRKKKKVWLVIPATIALKAAGRGQPEWEPAQWVRLEGINGMSLPAWEERGGAPGATQHPGASWPGELGPPGAVLCLCGLIRRIHTLKLHPGCMLDPVRTRATHEGAVSFTEKHL